MRVIGNGYIRRDGAGISYGAAPNTKQLSDWRFATNDDAAAVETAGFFNSMAGVMQVGERIFASLDLDGTPQAKDYMVSANTGTVVTIVKQTTT